MIMIAHKLETAVRYSDRVLVMDQGSVCEFASAKELLQVSAEGKIQGEGLFAQMVLALNSKQIKGITDLLV